ncbi:hypothetical protein GOBAR_DD22981 [Gossypium barbadense]|nr:hypothetical protein GOBAR_DD22981 [Gossypium barbadense]
MRSRDPRNEYNILPFDGSPIMKLPEIEIAVEAVTKMKTLSSRKIDGVDEIDIFSWLSSLFGFQILEKFTDGWWKSKINFVEVRTYWQVYRSFDRMWVFFIMALQAMIIVAWTQSGSTSANNEVVLRRVLSIFITYAILSFFRAILDVILSIHAWRNSDLTQPLRYILKLVVAAIWAVVLPVGYSTSVKNPTGPLKFLNHWARDSHNQSLDRELLLLPPPLANKPGDQFPLFLLASKIPAAINIAKEFKRKDHAELEKVIGSDKYTCAAILDCYYTLKSLIFLLLKDEDDKKIVDEVFHAANGKKLFLQNFNMSGMPLLAVKLEKFLKILMADYGDEEFKSKITTALQEIMYIIPESIDDNSPLKGALKRDEISHKYPSLRVAYIDEVDEALKEKTEGKTEKVYYSVLIKGDTINYSEREIYRIRLPGSPTKIGEGKPENQNHAIIFTRGEALQTIDMNQDNYFEEAFKMRNVLEEFPHSHGAQKPTILGLREHVFTGSVSSLAWFMSNQEFSFVTIGQRFLASPLRVRFHYGHPDIFDRIFHITRGGISKASKTINLSEDIFAGFNSTLRLGSVTHHDYMQVGKGRDVGMNQISIFEAKVANGNGEQTLTRDVHRLGCHFDFFRMLSFYCTTVGFYFNSLVTVLIVYVFLYGRLYMVMTGLEREILEDPQIKNNNALEAALVTQSFIQMGMLLVLPMLMEIGLEKGFRTALGDFFIMQLQLSSVFFTFQLGTKAHYFGKTILHGVNDWTDWKWWMGIRGGVGIQPENSWESWWDKEQEHLRYTSIRGRVLEILLALRFFVYQYGIVYQLDIAHHSRSLLVYGLSWCAVLVILIVPKVGQACRPCLHKLLWEPIKEVARAYDFMMGLLLFTPIAFLSWLPAVNEFQTRILFNQAFSRGLHISMILAGKKDGGASFN